MSADKDWSPLLLSQDAREQPVQVQCYNSLSVARGHNSTVSGFMFEWAF